MKYFGKTILIGMTALFIASCSSADDIRERERLEALNNVEMIKATKPSNLGQISKLSALNFNTQLAETKGVLVDVRTGEEFSNSHIKGAVNLDFKNRSFPDFINKINKEKAVYIYCGSGNRSGKAALIMQSLGFKNIYDLDGGFHSLDNENTEFGTVGNEANDKLKELISKTSLGAEAIAGISHQSTVEDFAKLVSESSVTVVDVRTPAEFAEGHIQGAVNVNWKDRDFEKNILEITDAKPMAIYCRSGNRGARAMFAMSSIGFKEIYNLNEGFNAWQGAGKKVKTLEVKGDIRHLDNANFNNAILGQVGVLIDVRTPSEYADYHIPGAGNIDYKNSNFEAECAKLDKNVPVLIYCRTGIRSGNAMEALEKLGLKVYNLNNGIKHWKSQGMKVEGANVHKKASGGEEGC